MDQTDTVLIDGNEQLLREIRLGRLFHFKEGRAKRRPIVNDLQEIYLGVLCTHSYREIYLLLYVRSKNQTRRYQQNGA